MPGDEHDEIGSPDDGRGQAKPPRLKWSEPLFIDEWQVFTDEDIDKILAARRADP